MLWIDTRAMLVITVDDGWIGRPIQILVLFMIVRSLLIEEKAALVKRAKRLVSKFTAYAKVGC